VIGIGFPDAGFLIALMFFVASESRTISKKRKALEEKRVPWLRTGLLIVLPSFKGGVRAIQKLLLDTSFEGVCGISRFSFVLSLSLGRLAMLGRDFSMTGGDIADGGP